MTHWKVVAKELREDANRFMKAADILDGAKVRRAKKLAHKARKISAEGLRRIRLAQKKRWSKVRKNNLIRMRAA